MAAKFNISSTFLALTVASSLMATTTIATAAADDDTINVDTRLSQRVLKESSTQRVYLRIGIKGRRNESETERTPVNVALVIDRSGSMKGQKIAKARDAALMAIDRLERMDTASVVVFDHRVNTLVSARRVNDHYYFKRRINEVSAGGRTAIHAAVEAAARELRRNMRPGQPSRIILMSDGQANVGPRRPFEFSELGRRLGSDGISVTTIGLGRGYNEDLMSQLASASDGNHAFARTANDLTRIFNGEFDDVLSVAAQDIEVIIETRTGITPIRTIGRNGAINGNTTRIKLQQVYGNSEFSLQLELEVDGDVAVGNIDLASIQINYTTKNGQRHSVRSSVRGTFSPSDDEVRASVDPKVMEPILELEARERYERVIKLRDKGRIDDARKLLKRNAQQLDEGQKKYRIKSKRLRSLSAQSRETAATISNTRQWGTSRKQMRMDQSNRYGGATKY